MKTFSFPRAVCWLFCLSLAACNGRTAIDDAKTGEAGQLPVAQLKPMDEEQREYLWQIEHHGNVLSQVAFPALAGALKQADEKALANILATGFVGEFPDQPNEVFVRNDVLEVVRQTDAGKTPTKLEANQFVNRLLDYRRFFKHAVKGGKIALMKLRPTQENYLDGPWEGTGQLRLWGEREPGKPAEVIVYLKYQTVRPTKAAIAAGHWLLGCSITQSQLGWSQRFLMQEVAAERGLEPAKYHDNWKSSQKTPVSGGIYLCDFNRDGYLDLLVTDINGYFLYKGLPDGKFQNVTAEMGLPETLPNGSPLSLVAAWVDLDGDGWEDLILGPYIFRNVNGTRFLRVDPLSNLHLLGDTAGIAVADYDGDGLMDLYVFRTGVGKADSWLEGKAAGSKGNQLYRNKGNWKFEDVTAKTGTDGGDRSTFTALWLDINNDGKPDLYVPNEFGDGVLYVNNGDGTFRPTMITDHPCDFGTMGATAGDIDGDGNIDLYCGNMYSKAGSRVMANVREGTYPDRVMAKIRTFVKGSELHLNRGGGRYEEKGQAWQVNDSGWAYGPALVDLDNDGWLDLHATCGYVSRDPNEPDG
jgi:hypothetical protein